MFRRRAKPNCRRETEGLRSPVTRQRFLRGLAAVAILFSGCAGYWCGQQPPSGMSGLVVWADQLFRITSVEISGSQRVSREEVLAVLDLSPTSGLILTELTPLKRVLQSHPWIQQAELRRVFPDTLVVELMEREPAAVLRTGRQDVLIGQDGGVIAEGSQGTYEGFPVLTGIAYAQVMARTTDITERLLAGIALASLLTEAGATGMEVDLRTPSDMVAYYNGFRIRFGEGGFEDKMERYRRLTDRILGPEAAGTGQAPVGIGGRKPNDVEVDLRFQDRVIVRDKGGKRVWEEKTKSS